MNTIVNDSGRAHATTQGASSSWNDAEPADDGLDPDFKPLTPEQAAAWRQRNPVTSPWRVLALQLLVGVLVAVLTGVVSGQFRLKQAGAALAGLFVWELVKIVLTVALLLVAPKVVAGLSWLALVAGFVVTMKVYWLAMALGWMRRKTRT